MSDLTSCVGCEYRHKGAIDRNTLATDHICLRYPPTTTPVLSSQGVVMITVYPNVDNGLQCGEYVSAIQQLQ